MSEEMDDANVVTHEEESVTHSQTAMEENQEEASKEVVEDIATEESQSQPNLEIDGTNQGAQEAKNEDEPKESSKEPTQMEEKPYEEPEPQKKDEDAPKEPTQMVEKTNEEPEPTNPDEKVAPAEHRDPSAMFATVTFVWDGDKEHMIVLPLSTTQQHMRVLMGEILKTPAENVDILFNGYKLLENSTLQSVGISDGDSLALEAQVREESKINSEPVAVPFSKTSITPLVPEEEEKKPVTIERLSHKKPFLGGYRHKVSMLRYHHASAQTAPAAKSAVHHVLCNTNCTQTYQQRHQKTETLVDTATQMTRPGIYVSNVTDKMVSLGRYENAESFKSKQTAKIVIIQMYYRRWLAKRYIQTLRDARDTRLQWEEDEQIRKQTDKRDRLRKDLERRMKPRTKEDFDLLFSALEKWRQQEVHRIRETLTGAERKAALYVLLDQETELIHAIERHQLHASEENREKFLQQLLGKAASPKKWATKKGETVLMDTPYSLRGRELLDIYHSLQMRYVTQDERLDVLLTLKHTVKEHECKLTMDIVELIDREVDMMMRGVKEEYLSGLRKRLLTLFLQYAKTPTFNPEVARHLRVPQDASHLQKDIHYCRSCGRYLRNTEFMLGSKSIDMGKCKRCIREDNLARNRQDLSTFKNMLFELRRNEENFHDNAQVAFLIEEADVRYLVENIWECMSILSSWEDLSDLVLARWRINEQWSPWNAILLTRDEAEAHYKVPSLQAAYGDMLIHRVKQKHILSKNYFAKLAHMSTTVERTKLQSGRCTVEESPIRQIGNITIEMRPTVPQKM